MRTVIIRRVDKTDKSVFYCLHDGIYSTKSDCIKLLKALASSLEYEYADLIWPDPTGPDFDSEKPINPFHIDKAHLTFILAIKDKKLHFLQNVEKTTCQDKVYKNLLLLQTTLHTTAKLIMKNIFNFLFPLLTPEIETRAWEMKFLSF